MQTLGAVARARVQLGVCRRQTRACAPQIDMPRSLAQSMKM